MTQTEHAAENNQSWEHAKKISDKIGSIPTIIPTAIRLLVSDHLTNNGAIRATTKFQIARIFRGDNFKSMLYFASRDLRTKELAATPSITVGEIVAMYKPLDLSLLIAEYVFHRKMKKLFTPDKWDQVLAPVKSASEVGAILGSYIEPIGIGAGLLALSAPRYGTLLAQAVHPSSVEAYHSASTTMQNNEAIELKLWKCSGTQIGALLLSKIGFGKVVVDGMMAGLSPFQSFSSLAEGLSRSVKGADLWGQAWYAGKSQPSERLPASFFPDSREAPEIERKIRASRADGTAWFARSKADLTPEGSPHFFHKSDVAPEFEVPDELKDVFTVKEITSMDEEDFDRLLDQIDQEQATGRAVGPDAISKKDAEELDSAVS